MEPRDHASSVIEVESPLKAGAGPSEDREMNDGEGSVGFSGDSAVDVDLSFAAFVFAHLGCPDATFEVRLGEGLLLEWCSACEALQTFGSYGG